MHHTQFNIACASAKFLRRVAHRGGAIAAAAALVKHQLAVFGTELVNQGFRRFGDGYPFYHGRGNDA